MRTHVKGVSEANPPAMTIFVPTMLQTGFNRGRVRLWSISPKFYELLLRQYPCAPKKLKLDFSTSRILCKRNCSKKCWWNWHLKDEEKVPLVTLNIKDFDLRTPYALCPPMMNANCSLNPTEQWSILASGNFVNRIESFKYLPSEEMMKKLTSLRGEVLKLDWPPNW